MRTSREKRPERQLRSVNNRLISHGAGELLDPAGLRTPVLIYIYMIISLSIATLTTRALRAATVNGRNLSFGIWVCLQTQITAGGHVALFSALTRSTPALQAVTRSGPTNGTAARRLHSAAAAYAQASWAAMQSV